MCVWKERRSFDDGEDETVIGEEDKSKEIFIFANLLICYIGRSKVKFLEWQRFGFPQTIH